MFQAFSAALGILFWFLKRKKARSHDDWKTDINKVNKAIADGDDNALTLAFDKLRLESNSSDTKRQDSDMPK
tara:strand:+ start:953 stop:1168 length:216 start_codon:yes stop_codon:yes gene_type:complete